MFDSYLSNGVAEDTKKQKWNITRNPLDIAWTGIPQFFQYTSESVWT